MGSRGWQNPNRRTPTPKPPALCKTCGEALPDYFLNPHTCNPGSIPVASDDPFGLEEPLRDRWGRPLIVPPEGGKAIAYTRVSTFAGALDEAGGLVTWKARQVALGIARHEDLAAMVAGLNYGDKLLDEHIETALCRVDDKAAWGTAVHSFTEPDAVEHVPERMQADVASYFQALADHDLTCVESERFVVHDDLRVAGTFDGVFTHPTLGRLIGDKKTGKVKAQAVALQLACYAGGVYYDALSGERAPLDVRQDVGLLFHIPKGEGKTEIHVVDLEAGRSAAKAAAWVMAWRKRDDLLTYLNPLTIADLAS